ncbi:hypothetical protein AB4084_16850, partial [Lysobacter sp. 2RAB21]
FALGTKAASRRTHARCKDREFNRLPPSVLQALKRLSHVGDRSPALLAVLPVPLEFKQLKGDETVQ